MPSGDPAATSPFLAPPRASEALAPLLQRGVRVPARTGGSVLEFLVGQLGIPEEYVRERITTLFLDGRVIDDAARATLRDGARLALSAALPGLVGATFRRGGAYAALRAAISAPADAGPGAGSGQRGVIQVKLFNVLLRELAPVLLAHGILLGPEDAAELRPALPELADSLRTRGEVLLCIPRSHAAEETP